MIYRVLSAENNFPFFLMSLSVPGSSLSYRPALILKEKQFFGRALHMLSYTRVSQMKTVKFFLNVIY
jgi:hypothetical protein